MMDYQRRWIGYDWLKLILLLILILIFIVLLLQKPALAVGGSIATPAALATVPAAAPVSTAALPTTEPAASPTIPATAVAALPTTPATAAAALPAATALPAPTETPAATLEPTAEPVQPTAAPTQIAAAPTQTAQPAPAAQASSGDCSKALPSRLAPGDKALVLVNLFLRTEPGMDKKVLLTSFPGSQVEITGGPVCIPFGAGVYRWWNVKAANGQVGWSAEGSLLGKDYFMQPLQ